MVMVMTSYVVNRTVFMHVHKLNDGTYVEHAHPYNKTNDDAPIKNHQHTKAQLLFCQDAQLLFFVFFVALMLIIFKDQYAFFTSKQKEYSYLFVHAFNGRGPPKLS